MKGKKQEKPENKGRNLKRTVIHFNWSTKEAGYLTSFCVFYICYKWTPQKR